MIEVKDLPQHVLDAIHKYKKGNESIEVFPAMIVLNGQKYYLVEYLPSGQIIITKDGKVPRFQEVEYAFILGNRVNNQVQTLVNVGWKWSKGLTIWGFKSVIKILEYFRSKLEEKMDREIEGCFNQFLEVAKLNIEKQYQIKEAYLVGKKIRKELLESEIVDEQMYHKTTMYTDIMLKASYFQNQSQIQSYPCRVKLLRFLASNIHPFNLYAWVKLMLLYYHHKRMLNEDKMDSEDRESMRILTEMMERNNTLLDFEGYEKEIEKVARNPR
ncbi:hypothetical protein JIR001_01170 [Polycladomyces abyssicola]|uniref:Uncharacterized protein n=1 Tax=Polycladomyces abyssicola TaxID=1125966 RepID=A0A8D5UDH3_9BACL|nr:hypothetical protein [Polycladomyces abyssicola]BCU80334.1 hypothetical protein JIR001_01170 [Polycladomyces abyssicola]